MPRADALALALLLAGLPAACRHLPGGARALPECPGLLRPAEEIPGEFLLRQRWRIRAREIDASLQLAVQKRGDSLVLVGFNPFGAKVFTVVQTGVRTEVESLPAAVLPVPPLNVLRDLHRARFLAAQTPPGPGGVAVAVRDGTRITEEWQQDSLRRRRFERLDGRPAGAVSVEFEAAPTGARAAGEVRIRNGWCGYEAVLSTLSEEPLP